jgi:hypothetical protein
VSRTHFFLFVSPSHPLPAGTFTSFPDFSPFKSKKSNEQSKWTLLNYSSVTQKKKSTLPFFFFFFVMPRSMSPLHHPLCTSSPPCLSFLSFSGEWFLQSPIVQKESFQLRHDQFSWQPSPTFTTRKNSVVRNGCRFLRRKHFHLSVHSCEVLAKKTWRSFVNLTPSKKKKKKITTPSTLKLQMAYYITMVPMVLALGIWE